MTDSGIHLDATTVRAELHEAPESHGLTAEQAAKIAAQSDEQINYAVSAAVDDAFWSMYDGVRSDAISTLANGLNIDREF